jgi:EAL domain-containing protein (putative c-di-GMP-specific phosphodiesterase class I)
VALEALLRWRHPDGTVWSADQFVEVAEDTGLILDIGDWVLRQACLRGATWVAQRPDRRLTMRVNISTMQLAEAGLLAALDEALSASGLDPHRLCIEISETALLHQTARVIENLAGIHERGISLAIDDFGTGYASLTYLDQFRIDVIKIDRSFVPDGGDDHRGLVGAIITMAAALGIEVTAEGVEHPDQAALLHRLGSPTAQGWLYSPAVGPDQVPRLLDQVFAHA